MLPIQSFHLQMNWEHLLHPGPRQQLKVTTVGKKRKAGGSMDHFVDRPQLSEQEEADANILFFRFEIMYLSYLKSLHTYTRI